MEVKLVLDTNAYCLCNAGNASALEQVERAEALFIPAVVYGELYYGLVHGARLAKNVRRLDDFIEKFDVQIIQVNTDVARKYGDIYASLRKRGKPIPTNDIWIAACTMSIGGTLLTADRHFTHVEQIQTEVIQVQSSSY